MSYDIAVVVPPIPAEDSEAWKKLNSLIDQEGVVPAALRRFHDRITARFPCSSTLPDDQVDDAVWSDAPIWNNFGRRAAHLGFSYLRADEVLPFLIETANYLGLIVFDWRTNRIHRGDGLREFTLTVENQPVLRGPNLQQLDAAVDALTPDSGPGFLILKGPGEDYTQAAGGDGVYTAEWREYTGSGFCHWVAGLPKGASKREVAIATNGFEIKVRANERLAADDVKAILRAFANSEGRPVRIAWRDVTERFTK